MCDWQSAYNQLSQGFSPWLPWRGLTAYDFMKHAGVYILAETSDDTCPTSVVDPGIIYIGETTKQSLLKRFVQFEEAARTGCTNRHLAGEKYFARAEGELIGGGHRLLPDNLCIAVMPVELEEPARSAFIRYTERAAIWYFVRANNRYPVLNTM